MEILMKRISGTLLATLAVGACAASTAALADNPAGFYLGAGVGYSTIRSDDPSYGLPGYFNDHQTAWKVIAGVRPVSILGAEFEYIDFGHPNHDYGYSGYNYYGLDSHPRASALFGVGYLPLPIPFIDIYARQGSRGWKQPSPLSKGKRVPRFKLVRGFTPVATKPITDSPTASVCSPNSGVCRFVQSTSGSGPRTVIRTL
jgi:hypothetical protein